MKRRITLPEMEESVTPALNFAAPSGNDRVMDELSKKMLSWGSLWFGPSGSCAPAEEHNLVRERLLSWLDRCIGRQARAVLSSRIEDVSLATSTPLLTAFLGRRAMLELSRRVLSDL